MIALLTACLFLQSLCARSIASAKARAKTVFGQLKKIYLTFRSSLYSNWNVRTSGNSGYTVLSKWRSTRIQAPRVQNPGRFGRFNIVQTSRSRGQHLFSKFAKIPYVGCGRTFKIPTSSRGSPFPTPSRA